MKRKPLDFPPDAEVFRNGSWKEHLIIGVSLTFGFVSAAILLLLFGSLRRDTRLALLILLVIAVLGFLLLWLLGWDVTVIHKGRVTVRENCGRVRSFYLSDVTGYRYLLTRRDPQFILYSGEKRLGNFAEMPGEERLRELLRNQGCPVRFSGKNQPESFRVGPFLCVEGDRLYRGKQCWPLASFRVERPYLTPKLVTPDGKRIAALPNYRNLDLLAWTLEQKGVSCRNLLPTL